MAKLPASESEDYFRSRPKASQIGSAVSPQRIWMLECLVFYWKRIQLTFNENGQNRRSFSRFKYWGHSKLNFGYGCQDRG